MREKLLPGLIAALLVGGLIGGILYHTRNNAVQLKGQILKVRSQTIEPGSTVAIIDFRVSNPSVQQFLVRDVAVKLEKRDGSTVDGDVFSEIDVQRLLSFYPTLGEKYNQSLIARDKIDPGASIDRMLAVRFPASDEELDNRKALRLIVTDTDGAVRELREQR